MVTQAFLYNATSSRRGWCSRNFYHILGPRLGYYFYRSRWGKPGGFRCCAARSTLGRRKDDSLFTYLISGRPDGNLGRVFDLAGAQRGQR